MKRGLTEKQVGLLMILPALIIILVIAIFPVLKSFYLSTYDLRLNSPTNRLAFTSYNLDVENYAQNYDALLNTFMIEIGSDNAKTKPQLRKLESIVKQADKQLMSDPKLAAQYKQVSDMEMNFKAVPQTLEYYKLNKTKALGIIKDYSQVETQLKQLQNDHQLKRAKSIIGALHGIQQTMIKPNFVGLANYKYFLTNSRMWNDLWNTTQFTIISVFIEFVLGLLIALVINKNFRGRGLVRAAVLIPWAIPTVVSAKIWLFLYNGEFGIMAKIFSVLGIFSMGDLLTTHIGQMFAVIFADVWKTTPFMALLLLAGLQTIPDNLYEAARVDGASKIQQFFKITLPLLKSSILVALLFRTLDAFRIFDLVYVMLGHSQSTEVITSYAYQVMFAETDFGKGSTLAVVVFICIAIISAIYVKLLGSDLIEREAK